jgi:hypothetical protein
MITVYVLFFEICKYLNFLITLWYLKTVFIVESKTIILPISAQNNVEIDPLVATGTHAYMYTGCMSIYLLKINNLNSDVLLVFETLI